MKGFDWPRNVDQAVAVPNADHPHVIRVTEQILAHARVGRAAFQAGRMSDAKYERDYCSLLLWRLSADGLTADGQLKIDGAKWETRIPGRLSSAAARSIRESSDMRDRSQSAFMNLLIPDHVVPRNRLVEILIRPDGVDLDDQAAARAFLVAHAEIAVISPKENEKLKDRGFESRMPEEWWSGSFAEKLERRLARYKVAQITLARWPVAV